MIRYKLIMFCLLAASLVFGLFSLAQAQEPRRVPIAPGPIGTLNNAIFGDTTETGARVDTNTVYVLERGDDKIYILNGSIDHRFPLTIISEGEGDRPKIVPGVGDGGESSRAFRPRADLTVKGCYVTNQDDQGGTNTRMFRISAGDITIAIDDCHLDRDAQSCFRFDSDNIRLFITNSVISNIGVTTDPNNGRGMDDRGNDIDSIHVVNTTFYNVTSRILRDDGGWIKYAKFDNCTFVNVAQWLLTFGEAVEAYFTNNLVINGAFLGNSDNDDDPNFLVEVDSLIDSALVAQGYTQTVEISNNNFYLDTELDAAYPDSVSAATVFNPTAQAFVSKGTMIKEAITFTDGPDSPIASMQGMYADRESSDEPTAPPMDDGDPPAYGNPGFGNMPFDFSYSTSAVSYTHGIDGNPLGDLNWFGLASALEEEILISSPKSFRLQQNYPNPFNPTTTISYNLQNASNVSLTIYNVLGKKVRTLLSQKQGPGDYEVVWDGKDELGINLASGIFFYTIQTEKIKQTKRMLLLK